MRPAGRSNKKIRLIYFGLLHWKTPFNELAPIGNRRGSFFCETLIFEPSRVRRDKTSKSCNGRRGS